MSGPSVLVLGGTGFIGKNLVQYLIEYNLAGRVRVADKTPPFMAYMDKRFEETFEKDMVEFIQCDLWTEAGTAKAFNNERYNIVINLAGLTKFGCEDFEYDRVKEMKIKCAKMAESLGCDKYVEVGSCSVYKVKDSKGEKPSKEDDKIEPHELIAAMHYNSEHAILEQCPSLPFVITRLPNVYGPGDTSGLIPRLACAASYVDLGEDMELLYSDDLRMHTLHVQDAVGGIWYVACAGVNREVYNLVDKNDTTQKKFNKIVEEIFPIKTHCVGHMTTNIYVKSVGNLDKLLVEANDKHLTNWSELLNEKGCSGGHLTTYLCKEQLQGTPVSAVGTKVEALGFEYSVPTVTADYLRHALQYWINLGQFPDVLK
eukprot:TRINITY_DN10601_c1_g1_i1.p1 TRINITY_DN10601_c1_g1~~TRINITY_DN10601_c1_g1_i1.p1  ORF type:complete len:385 (+),score=87.03 TRINITY_DN10601_c1_g1_i1:43-1155(+)